MIPVSSIATIPTPPRVVLIRVNTHDWRGERYDMPVWHIVGDLVHYEYNQQWLHFEMEVTLGLQKDGSHLLDVTDLGLDPKDCLAYADAEERCEQLKVEEDMYGLHDNEDDGPCLCGQIATQYKIMKSLEPAIEEAVFARFDTWTRRRHLVALGSALGFTSFDIPAWLERLGLVPEPKTEVEGETPPAEAPVIPALPSPPITDWDL